MVTLEKTAYFQLGQLRVAQAAALNPREAALATEYAQVAPHLAFGITVGGKQMLGIGEMTHIGGNLPLQIFSLSGPLIVASAQSSRVISVNGRRAEEEG